MTRIDLEYEFENDSGFINWVYSPSEYDIKDALVDIITDKFNIKDDAGVEAIEKICYQDEYLAYRIAAYYDEELTEYFKKMAKQDFEDNYILEEPDEWDAFDVYWKEKDFI